MIKTLFFTTILSSLLLAERVQPIHMQAHDAPSYHHYDSGYSSHYYDSHHYNNYNNYDSYDRQDDREYHNNYENSSNRDTTEDRVISSTAEASAEITIVTTIEGISEITSQRHNDHATMSFLDNNRLQITEDMAKGEGEHLSTLLHLMNIKEENITLTKIQENFEELSVLNHRAFLKRLTTI